MKYTEKQISKMASPISQSEDEKCKNAIRMVRDAMKRLNYTDDGKDIRSYMAESYSYVHVLLGKHADTGNVVRNQTAHAGDSAVLTSMYSAMRRS